MDNKISPTVVIKKKDIVDEDTVRNHLKASHSDEISSEEFTNNNLITSTPVGVKRSLRTRNSLRCAAKISGKAGQKLKEKDELQTTNKNAMEVSLNSSPTFFDKRYLEVDLSQDNILASVIGQQTPNRSDSIEFDSPPDSRSRKKSRKNPTPKRKRNTKVQQEEDDDEDDVIMSVKTPICPPQKKKFDETDKTFDEPDCERSKTRKRVTRSAARKARQKVKRLDWDDESMQMSFGAGKDDEYVEDESIKMEEEDDDDDSLMTSKKSFSRMSTGRDTSKRKKWMDSMDKDVVLNLRKQQQAKNLFPDWLPKKDSFKSLTFEEGVKYLPVNQKVKFRVQSKATVPSEEQSIELDLFDYHKTEDSFTIKMGGPLWSMDWCPTPMDRSHDQLLALYTHQSAAQTFTTTLPQTYNKKCIIQIWNFGKLSNRMSNTPPELLPLLVMDGGPIWQMKWSPGASSWLHGDDIDDGDEKVFKSRIGLLACACHSGNVKFLSIPRLKNKDSQKSKTKNISFFEVDPILTLKTTGSSCIPCTTVDWNINGSQVVLAAGFADGSVSLWNLNTPTSLLGGIKTEGSNPSKNFMHAYKTFKAHLLVVSGVHFCPTSDNLLLTCSHDKFMKVWNIHDTNGCVLAHRAYKITASAWPAHERSRFYAGFDEAYANNRNIVGCYNFYENKVVNTSHCIHNSTIMSMSHREWSSIITSCDNTGCVQSCLSLPEKIKSIFNYRKLISMTELVYDKDQGDNNDNNDVGCDCKNYDEPPKHDLGSFPISCCCNKSFLIKDFNKSWQFESIIKKQGVLPFDDVLKKPYCAIHKVSWNTNKQCYDWIAFGGLNGLLRIRLVPDLNPQKK